MKTTANTTETFEELDHRESDGIEVTLLWGRAEGNVVVTVHDARTAECFELSVRPDQALDAFRHPFAYAAGCADIRDLERRTLAYL